MTALLTYRDKAVVRAVQCLMPVSGSESGGHVLTPSALAAAAMDCPAAMDKGDLSDNNTLVLARLILQKSR